MLFTLIKTAFKALYDKVRYGRYYTDINGNIWDTSTGLLLFYKGKILGKVYNADVDIKDSGEIVITEKENKPVSHCRKNTKATKTLTTKRKKIFKTKSKLIPKGPKYVWRYYSPGELVDSTIVEHKDSIYESMMSNRESKGRRIKSLENGGVWVWDEEKQDYV
jgi:hypothetical protein